MVGPVVVAKGTRGHDLDLMAPGGKPGGHLPAGGLGAAKDLVTVALDPEEKLQLRIRSSISAKTSGESWGLSSARRRRPRSTNVLRNDGSPITRPTASATSSGLGSASSRPAPPSVSGTAVRARATIGTSNAIASTRGTQNPSCSLRQTSTSARRYAKASPAVEMRPAK